MAYLCIVINVPNETIAQLNADAQKPTKVSDEINALVNVLNGINGGEKPASVQVTTRSTDPSIATAGSGSQQFTYNHL